MTHTFLSSAQQVIQQNQQLKVTIQDLYDQLDQRDRELSSQKQMNFNLNSIIKQYAEQQSEQLSQEPQYPQSYVVKLQNHLLDLESANKQWDSYFKTIDVQVKTKLEGLKNQIRTLKQEKISLEQYFDKKVQEFSQQISNTHIPDDQLLVNKIKYDLLLQELTNYRNLFERFQTSTPDQLASYFTSQQLSQHIQEVTTQLTNQDFVNQRIQNVQQNQSQVLISQQQQESVNDIYMQSNQIPLPDTSLHKHPLSQVAFSPIRQDNSVESSPYREPLETSQNIVHQEISNEQQVSPVRQQPHPLVNKQADSANRSASRLDELKKQLEEEVLKNEKINTLSVDEVDKRLNAELNLHDDVILLPQNTDVGILNPLTAPTDLPKPKVKGKVVKKVKPNDSALSAQAQIEVSDVQRAGSQNRNQASPTSELYLDQPLKQTEIPIEPPKTDTQNESNIIQTNINQNIEPIVELQKEDSLITEPQYKTESEKMSKQPSINNIVDVLPSVEVPVSDIVQQYENGEHDIGPSELDPKIKDIVSAANAGLSAQANFSQGAKKKKKARSVIKKVTELQDNDILEKPQENVTDSGLQDLQKQDQIEDQNYSPQRPESQISEAKQRPDSKLSDLTQFRPQSKLDVVPEDQDSKHVSEEPQIIDESAKVAHVEEQQMISVDDKVDNQSNHDEDPLNSCVKLNLNSVQDDRAAESAEEEQYVAIIENSKKNQSRSNQNLEVINTGPIVDLETEVAKDNLASINEQIEQQMTEIQNDPFADAPAVQIEVDPFADTQPDATQQPIVLSVIQQQKEVDDPFAGIPDQPVVENDPFADDKAPIPAEIDPFGDPTPPVLAQSDPFVNSEPNNNGGYNTNQPQAGTGDPFDQQEANVNVKPQDPFDPFAPDSPQTQAKTLTAPGDDPFADVVEQPIPVHSFVPGDDPFA